MKYLQIREKIELYEYRGMFTQFNADVITMLSEMGLNITQADKCFTLAAELMNCNYINTLNLALRLGHVFKPSSLQDRENNPMITIGHFHGQDTDITERTGYPHLAKTNEDINDVTRRILDVGLNVQVLRVKESYVVYISHDRFVQR